MSGAPEDVADGAWADLARAEREMAAPLSPSSRARAVREAVERMTDTECADFIRECIAIWHAFDVEAEVPDEFRKFALRALGGDQ